MYKDNDPQETREWIESIEDALEEHGHERTRFLLETLISYAQKAQGSLLIQPHHISIQLQSSSS